MKFIIIELLIIELIITNYNNNIKRNKIKNFTLLI